MRNAAIVVLVAVAALLGAAWLAPSVSAQQPITVVSEEPRNEYPQGVTFAVSFKAPADTKEVRLQYHLAPDGTGATAVAICTGTGTVSCTYSLTSGRGIFIIPGAEITYHWEISDTVGDQLSTPDKLYVHEDTRFTFATLQQDNVTLHYHSGSESQAQAVLNAAVDTLQKVGQLEQTQVTFPVKVFLYTTAEEMQPSIAAGGEGRGVTVLGEVVYSDTAMVSADVATLDITRHEVAHIVTREATKGPYGVPAWFNEGISVFSQSKPLSGHDAALQAAVDSDTVLSMRELNSSATGSVGATVGLYYGEAGSIVKYLVDTFGPEKFAQLLKTFKEGTTPDKAFQSVYGFDSLGLENNWRQSVGLPPRAASATATPRATTEARAPVTPAGGATPAASPGSPGGGGNVTAVVIIVLLMVLVLGAAGAAIVVVRRRV